MNQKFKYYLEEVANKKSPWTNKYQKFLKESKSSWGRYSQLGDREQWMLFDDVVDFLEEEYKKQNKNPDADDFDEEIGQIAYDVCFDLTGAYKFSKESRPK